MDYSSRTLVILLSMHRCGSSLTTNVLQRLGLSLGPFELNGAYPSNPLGHFEAMPFMQLNREIQNRAFGFPDDFPHSPQLLDRFCQTQGQWPAEVDFPTEMLQQGRELIRTLVDSGEVSGFKDPRTVLTWPFWTRVLQDYPGLRILPVSLCRSPHEIAMSMVRRCNGWCGYWISLDLIAVHLRRQRAILESWDAVPPPLCFGRPDYLERLEAVVRRCGLTWSRDAAIETFDRSYVHQTPASVAHEAQSLFEALVGEAGPAPDSQDNRAQLEKDSRALESLRLQQWQASQAQLRGAREQARQAESRVDRAQVQLSALQSRLDACERQRDQA
jgi:hypothetical protein